MEKPEETEQEKSCSDDGVRKSGRSKRPPQSFSPHQDISTGDRNDVGKVKKRRTKHRSATAPDRPCDILANGEPFVCDLCKSPYVINRSLKRALKHKRSRHNPAPRNKMDPITGKILVLCNACSITFDRPRKPKNLVSMPTAEEKQKCLTEAKAFAKKLAEDMNRPEAERLYCPVVKTKACGCLQKYIMAEGDPDESERRAKDIIDLLLKARQLSTEKCYPQSKVTSPVSATKKKATRIQGVGIGNGQKRSKAFEEFVFSRRIYLKKELKLCETGAQKVLTYSNNFLHKKLVTEQSVCRAKPVKGLARMGLLQPFDKMCQQRCCVDNCVMMAITHKKLLQDWRVRASKGQSENRRVIAEMLTPSAGARTNCYTFITMVTGSSRSTIVQVSHQMKQTGGEREPPTHGMKKFWQGSIRRKSPTKVHTRAGKSSSGVACTQSTGAKQNVVTSSTLPTTTTDVVIPVSINASSSKGTSLTGQRQQLMQIQQQMFEQQVQQQQQQHLLQQQLLQHTIMQQIGQATEGMPQNLPMLQQMIDQLNVQIQNTQQQLQQSLKTMNMIGTVPNQSQPSGGETGSSFNGETNLLMSSDGSNTAVGHSRTHHVATGTSGGMGLTPHSGLVASGESSETGLTQHTHHSEAFIANPTAHSQSANQGEFTQQFLSNWGTPEQQNLQYFTQVSPSQFPIQSHTNVNIDSQQYFNSITMQNNGQAFLHVQQSPTQLPQSPNTQFLPTFIQSLPIQKGQSHLNETCSSEHIVVQNSPNVNPAVQLNISRSPPSSLFIQQFGSPTNQETSTQVVVVGPHPQQDGGEEFQTLHPTNSSVLSRDLCQNSENRYQLNVLGINSGQITDKDTVVCSSLSVETSSSGSADRTLTSTSTGASVSGPVEASAGLQKCPIPISAISLPNRTCVFDSTSQVSNASLCSIGQNTSTEVTLTSASDTISASQGKQSRQSACVSVSNTVSSATTDVHMSKTGQSKKLKVSRKSAFYTPHKIAISSVNTSNTSISPACSSVQSDGTVLKSRTILNTILGNSHQHVRPNECVPNVSIPELSMSQTSIGDAQQITKVTQSRFPTPTVRVMPSATEMNAFLHHQKPTIPTTRLMSKHPHIASHLVKKLAVLPVSVGLQSQKVNTDSTLPGRGDHTPLPKQAITTAHVIVEKSATTRTSYAGFATKQLPQPQQNLPTGHLQTNRQSVAKPANEECNVLDTRKNSNAAILDVHLNSVGSERPERVMSVPVSLFCPASCGSVTIPTHVASTSNSSMETPKHATQPNNPASSQCSVYSTSLASTPNPAIPGSGPQCSVSAHDVQVTAPYIVSSATQGMKPIVNTSQVITSWSGPQFQNMPGSARWHGNVPGTTMIQLQPQTLHSKGTEPVDVSQIMASAALVNSVRTSIPIHQGLVSRSNTAVTNVQTPLSRTMQLSQGSHPFPLTNNSVLPAINCTLFINQGQPGPNQLRPVNPGQCQPIAGQIQPLLVNTSPNNMHMPSSSLATQLTVDTGANGGQRLLCNDSALAVTPVTIDSDVLLRLCQQAFPRVPVTRM